MKSTPLPTWYSLEKYAGARILDDRGLLEQLLIRRFCAGMVRMLPRASTETEARIIAALNLVRETPIADVQKFSTLLQAAYSYLPSEVSNATIIRQRRPSVRSMTLRDLLIFRQGISHNCVEEASRWLDENSLVIGKPSTSAPEWIDKPILDFENADEAWRWPDCEPVFVNLALPNKSLIDGFEEWLKRARLRTNTEARKPTSKRPTWEKVLPCADLTLWATQEGHSFTDLDLAHALFPKQNVDEDKVKETIRPETERVVFNDCLFAPTDIEVLLQILET